MLGRLGPLELGIILVIILLLVGPKKLPELARSMGQGIKEFKSAGKEVKDDITDDSSPKEN